jgi:hypothetical protein
MKKNLLKFVLGLLLFGSMGICQAQFNSPVGVWDFILSGSHETGIAILDFKNDIDTASRGTFSGYILETEVIRPAATGGRTAGNDGRGTGSGNSGTSAGLFGFGPVNGPWFFDNKGRIIGYFTQVLEKKEDTTNWIQTSVNAVLGYTVLNSNGVVDFTSSTNLSFSFTEVPFTNNLDWTVVSTDNTTNQFTDVFLATTSSNYVITLNYIVTNADGTLDRNSTTNFALDLPSPQSANFPVAWEDVSSDGTTNQYLDTFNFTTTNNIIVGTGSSTNTVSFIGKVSQGKFSLVASTSFGTLTYKGVPYFPVTDLTGSWLGVKKQNEVTLYETFSLVPSGLFENIYFTTNGTGPGYTYSGFAVVSVQKKIGFAFQESSSGATNLTLRTTVGKPTVKNSVSAKTEGIIANESSGIRFDAFQLP